MITWSIFNEEAGEWHIPYFSLSKRNSFKKVPEKYLNGEIFTVKAICTEVELAVKKSVSDDYLWHLFKRHGFKKKAPRPEHHLQNFKAQEE